MASIPTVLLVGPAERTAALAELLTGDVPALDCADFPGPVVDALPNYRLAVIDAHDNTAAAAAFAQHWRSTQAAAWRPLLWLADDAYARSAGWNAGADACMSRPFAIGEVAAQICTLLHRHEEHMRLSAWALEAGRLNRSLNELYAQLEADARLARLVQHGQGADQCFQIGRMSFAVSQRRNTVGSGDFYAIREGAGQRISVLLGDVMGHSLGASLLAIYVQQLAPAFLALAPGQALVELNQSLLTLGTSEPPLVQLSYALLNGKTAELTIATAGHTAPLLLPRNAPPRYVAAHGSMLGLCSTSYATQTLGLQSGDRVLLYTDGVLDTVPEAAAQLATVAVRHRELPMAAQLESIAQDHATATDDGDEFTLLGIEVG